MYLFHFTYTCMQIILHSADFAGDKYVTFNSSDACFFVRPDYFDHQDFLSLLLQTFISTCESFRNVYEKLSKVTVLTMSSNQKR